VTAEHCVHIFSGVEQ